MAIKRTASAVIGRPCFLGNGHLSSYFFVYRHCQLRCQRGIRRRLSLTGICTSISSHLKIDRSGRGEGSPRQARGKFHLSPHLHARGRCLSSQLKSFLCFFFLFILAGVATHPASAYGWKTVPGTCPPMRSFFLLELGREGGEGRKPNDGLEASSNQLSCRIFPSARNACEEPDIG